MRWLVSCRQSCFCGSCEPSSHALWARIVLFLWLPSSSTVNCHFNSQSPNPALWARLVHNVALVNPANVVRLLPVRVVNVNPLMAWFNSWLRSCVNDCHTTHGSMVKNSTATRTQRQRPLNGWPTKRLSTLKTPLVNTNSTDNGLIDNGIVSLQLTLLRSIWHHVFGKSGQPSPDNGAHLSTT